MIERRKNILADQMRLLGNIGSDVLADIKPIVISIKRHHELALTTVAGTQPAPQRVKIAADMRMKKVIRTGTPVHLQTMQMRQNL